MRKLQTLFLVLISLSLITSCKHGAKTGPEDSKHIIKDAPERPQANANHGKEFAYEGYIVPYNLASMVDSTIVMCALRENFDLKDPNSGVAVVEQMSIPFGQTKNRIYYKNKKDDYTKIEVYDNEGNKHESATTKFKITGKAMTIEGQDRFILEEVVITKL